jgi:hypothetical protein
MGTNYYVWIDTNDTAPDGVEFEELHIGKSSSGWVFSLRVYPDRDINTLYDWLPILLNPANGIRDEYNRQITAYEMMKTITCRSRVAAAGRDQLGPRRRPAGPNNLVRGIEGSEYDRGRSHGEGTWDYCDYEFD